MLYSYGPAAWIWRGLTALFVLIGSAFLIAGLLALEPFALLGAVALLCPVFFFGTVVAVRAYQGADGSLRIETLLFFRRTIPANRIGVPRVRVSYETEWGRLSAPRVWVPVKGGLPVYFDLLGRIPDRQRLMAVLKIRGKSPTL